MAVFPSVISVEFREMMKHEKTNGHSFAPSRSDPRLVLSRVIFYLRKAAAAKRKWERGGYCCMVFRVER